MNKYEQKIAARQERYKRMAEKAREESASTYRRAKEMLDEIPLGQPIHVGHHSEQRDRNYRDQIDNTFRKSVNLDKKAEYYDEKAASVGTGGISSDDPDAIDKLREELEMIQEKQRRMKAVNKALRTHKTQEKRIAALVSEGFTEEEASELLSRPGFFGYESFTLQNNNAKARRIAHRISQLEALRERGNVEHKGRDYTYREDVGENRVMFIFDGKPDADTRDLLKRHRFKWSPSRGAWVRQLGYNGIVAGREARKALDARASADGNC
ncbi:MAG TPA: DUF3560 domain-containing protein [Halothiobacillus sp.]|nr:DUF3560 domain-containing protein [Halothiobacillus sp.]